MKLIRDLTQFFLEKDGAKLRFRRASESQRRSLLNQKLFEEVVEYSFAEGNEAKQKELADILEALHSLAALDNIPWNNIEVQTLRKHAARGGYDNLIVMDVVIDEDKHPAPKVIGETWDKNFDQPKKSPEVADGYDPLLYGSGDGPWYSG